MSVMEPDPDLVRIGQSPEWARWVEEALAYFEDRAPRTLPPDKPWQPVGIRSESLTAITMYDEKTRVRDDLVPLVRAAVHEYAIAYSPYPWNFVA